MAIVRNKKNTPSPDHDEAIAAFGAAAEARPEQAAAAGDPAPAVPTRKPAEPDASKTPPRTSLIRWEGGNEDLRDAVIDYHRRERYPIHTVLLEAIRRGLAEMERDS